ncbi:hypothetical protein BH23CHL1_BH23CHL1_08660 [soil metagenome]
MPKLKTISGKNLVRDLQNRGWTIARQSGSHVTLKMEGRRVTVPVHSNQDLPIGTFRSILTEAGIDADEYRQ